MKALAILLSLFLPAMQTVPALYMCRDVKTVLYSEAPVENIEAVSGRGISVLNTTNGEVMFKVQITSFQFKKALMEEHFNENYMESEKFPNAAFQGKINEAIDFAKNGEYPVTVSGNLVVHGVSKPRTIKGTVRVKDNMISIASKFNVLCKDHGITIPKLVFRNIAENIQITVTGDFSPAPAKSKP